MDETTNVQLTDVLAQRQAREPGHGHAIIEIADNAEHPAEFAVTVGADQTLEIRAANHCRPFLRVSDRSGQEIEKCHFHGILGSRLILKGLLFGEAEILVDGEFSSVHIRHCTLTPGKTLLVIRCNDTEVRIEDSIVGQIVTCAPDARKPAAKPRKTQGEESPFCPPRYNEPIRLRVFDSVVDGTNLDHDPRRPQRPGRKAPESEHALTGAGH